MKSKVIGAVTLAVAAAGLFAAAAPAFAQQKTITVWWGKGFYRSEDDALLDTIKKFEAKTGIKVELSQYAIQDMIPKTVAALDAGTVPDVAYSDTYDVQAQGKWAYEGKLEDLTDVMEPIQDRFAPNTLEASKLYNDVAKKKAYYGFPLKQQSMHVQIWKDMLEKAGFKQSDIPNDWEGYWTFWCDKVQPGIRKATGQRIYAVGQPMGVESTDAFQSFYTFMDAYHVKLVDDDGKLTVDDPKVRDGLIQGDEGLHRHLYQGLHPALLDDLEGSRQQRRLPQQDDRDDPQFHDLDRGEMVRGLAESGAHARAARSRQEGL